MVLICPLMEDTDQNNDENSDIIIIDDNQCDARHRDECCVDNDDVNFDPTPTPPSKCSLDSHPNHKKIFLLCVPHKVSYPLYITSK